MHPRLGAVCDDFQIAVERARERIGERVSEAVSSHEQTIEIYRESRALDAERTAQEAARNRTTTGGDGTAK